MLGGGKYVSECILVRDRTEASGVIVIVFDGKEGNGFSCAATLNVQLQIPEILRTLADNIEEYHKSGKL